MQIVKIQSVSFTIASSASSGTGSLSGFTTLGKMVPLFASWRVADGQSPVLASNTEVDFVIDSTSQITASRWGTPAYAITCRVFVVEFGSDTTVQKGTWAMTNAETTDTQSINTSTLANTFCKHYRKNEGEGAPSDDSDPDGRITFCKFNSTTQLGFERYTAKGACSGHWYTVSSATLTVEHGNHTISSSSALSVTDTITSVTLGETFVISSYTINQNQYNDEGVWTTDLSSTTTIRFRRDYSFGAATDATWEYQIVSDPAITVQRGEFNVTGTTDNSAISAVILAQSVAKSGCGMGGFSSTSEYTNGTLDGRYWELWLGSTVLINGQTGDGLADLITTWEVVELEIEAPERRRRIFIIT